MDAAEAATVAAAWRMASPQQYAPFDGDGVRFAEEVAVEARQRSIRGLCDGRVTSLGRRHHVRNGGRRDVGSDRDDTITALKHVVARHAVLTCMHRRVGSLVG